MGMWIFLATEVMLFGGLFCGYTVYRVLHPRAFAEASTHLYTWIGGTNTAVLLLSSFTMAMGVRSAKLLSRRATIIFLSITVLLGLTFLGLKGLEYTLDWHDRIVPGRFFDPHGNPNPGQAEMFMIFYFIMTGLHTVHMLAAIGVMGTIAFAAARVDHMDKVKNAVEIGGLYWHFVDIVWIFLLPLLYLIK